MKEKNKELKKERKRYLEKSINESFEESLFLRDLPDIKLVRQGTALFLGNVELTDFNTHSTDTGSKARCVFMQLVTVIRSLYEFVKRYSECGGLSRKSRWFLKYFIERIIN